MSLSGPQFVFKLVVHTLSQPRNSIRVQSLIDIVQALGQNVSDFLHQSVFVRAHVTQPEVR